MDPKVNDNFLLWLIGKYASNQIGEIKAVRGKKHNYLVITLYFSLPGMVKVNITQYVSKMFENFPQKLNSKTKCL
jgi:hypothetical protein